MATTRAASSGKWKHGLSLVTCEACLDERRIGYNCHLCNDFGERWMTQDGRFFRVTELPSRVPGEVDFSAETMV